MRDGDKMPREKVESTDQGQNCQNHEWNEHAGGRFTARPGSGERGLPKKTTTNKRII